MMMLRGHKHMLYTRRNQSNGRSIRLLVYLTFLLASCSHLDFHPAPIVPTLSPLPYSGKIRLTEIESYMVRPGAVTSSNAQIESQVTQVSDSLSAVKKEWERAIADYLATRKTFTYLSTDSQTDLDVSLRLNVYIDPGLDFSFHHVYLARADASLINPRTGRLQTYQGVGKSVGDVVRGGKEDDQDPTNAAVQSALNDLFGKIENDSTLRR
jgi:hypothetical protein